jgi:aromatic-amino-acid transaminase
MNLYGERCGALSVVCENADDATRVLGQLGFGARRTYSNPPTHGCRIATTVLRDEALRAAWLLEVRAMRDRMVQMRTALHEALVTRAPHVDFGYLLRQRGMFSFTGLSRAQVVRLREEHALYMLENGRLCVAGLNTGNVERAAAAIAAVV